VEATLKGSRSALLQQRFTPVKSIERFLMTDHEIVTLYDSTNITLSDLSIRSGRSVEELKALLMETGDPFEEPFDDPARFKLKRYF
jgi:hypothetical protein